MNKIPQSKPTIYIVDDDSDDSALLIKAIEQITDEHDLEIFSNGKSLIKLLDGIPEEELPCLIVLDYNMPGLNGKEVLNYLQNDDRYRRIPKIIYTTSDSRTDKAEFLSLGVNEYLTKASTFQGILNSAKIMLSHCDHKVRLIV
jgi:CheY-like chemotaxis protein